MLKIGTISAELKRMYIREFQPMVVLHGVQHDILEV
jgi:hypothetical protein